MKYVLLLICLVALSSFASAQSYEDLKTDANLVLYDSYNGTTSGALQGDAHYVTGGPFGQQWLDCDGSGDSVIYSGGSAVNLDNNSYTVAAWFEFDNPTVAHTLFRQDDATVQMNHRLDNSGNMVFYDTSGTNILTSTPPPTSTLVHIAVVHNNATETLVYIDGVETYSDTSVTAYNQNLYTVIAAIDGRVGELFFFDRVLTETEVGYLISGPSSGSPLLLQLLLTSVVFTLSLVYFARRQGQ